MLFYLLALTATSTPGFLGYRRVVVPKTSALKFRINGSIGNGNDNDYDSDSDNDNDNDNEW